MTMTERHFRARCDRLFAELVGLEPWLVGRQARYRTDEGKLVAVIRKCDALLAPQMASMRKEHPFFDHDGSFLTASLITNRRLFHVEGGTHFYIPRLNMLARMLDAGAKGELLRSGRGTGGRPRRSAGRRRGRRRETRR